MINNKLDTVLIIDDSDADNFLHKRLIEKSGIVEQIVIKKNGFEALDYLTTPIDGVYPCPELVFLDINMPGLDGWGFLEEYLLIEEYKKAEIIICMLTTAYSEKDKERAKKYGLVDGYIGKPLTKDKLMKICDEILFVK